MQSCFRSIQRGACVGRRLSAGIFQEARETSIKALTSQFSTSRFAVIDHSEAYEAAIQGPHGQKLALARLEGVGKDDPPFDPFLAEELAALGEEGEEEEEAEEPTEDEGEDADPDEEEPEEDPEEEVPEEAKMKLGKVIDDDLEALLVDFETQARQSKKIEKEENAAEMQESYSLSRALFEAAH